MNIPAVALWPSGVKEVLGTGPLLHDYLLQHLSIYENAQLRLPSCISVADLL